MNFYKEFFLTTLEICFAIFIIIFGYAIWDNFDQTEYETAKYYDNINEFEVFVEDNDSYISFINEPNAESTKLYLHNIGAKNSYTKLSLKISKDNNCFKENVILVIDNKYYELNKLDLIEDEYFYYCIIDEINFKGYETKEYDIKLFLKDKNFNNEYLDYEFVANV